MRTTPPSVAREIIREFVCDEVGDGEPTAADLIDAEVDYGPDDEPPCVVCGAVGVCPRWCEAIPF